MTFSEWLEKNPPPDLEMMAKEFGGYDRIPDKVWKKLVAARERWQAEVKLRSPF